MKMLDRCKENWELKWQLLQMRSLISCEIVKIIETRKIKREIVPLRYVSSFCLC